MSTLLQRISAQILTSGVRATNRLQSLTAAKVPAPPDDPFYTPRDDFGSSDLGTVLDWRPVTVNMFGRAIKADSWQVLYRTADTAGDPAAVVATVMVPRRRFRGQCRPLLSYQCAIDSLSPRADPSFTLRRGTQKELPLMGLALLRGWAVVTSDYTGPRRAYGAGLIAGREVLDGIRAALALEPAGLGPSTPIGLWGYSGGGQASAWAAEQHPSYAPELNIAMVAAGGVPADLNACSKGFDGTIFSGLGLGATLGLAREFPDFDLESLLNDEGRAAMRRAADMTVEELAASFPFRRMSDFTESDDPTSLPAVRDVLARNNLGVAMPTAPLYYYQSIFDQLCLIAPLDALVAKYRQAGVDIEYRRSRAGEHCIYAAAGAPGALRALARGFAKAETEARTAEPALPRIAAVAAGG